MNKRHKNINKIRNIVGGLPTNYDAVESNIISKINILKDNDKKNLNIWLHEHLYQFPIINKHWKRKHIYLLVHDLIELFNSDIDIQEILYDVESGIIGECSADALIRYSGEPEDIDKLSTYITSLYWL